MLIIRVEGFHVYNSDEIIPIRFHYEVATYDILYNVVFIQLEIDSSVHQIILN